MAISKINDIQNQCNVAFEWPKCILKICTTVPSRLYALIEKIKMGIAVGALVSRENAQHTPASVTNIRTQKYRQKKR